jgi:hypothetical protein
MSLFGQVWLWSAAAFVVGVLLTWVVLVRPAQARNRVLERRLLAAQTAPAPKLRPAPPMRAFDQEPEPETQHVQPQFQPAFEPEFDPTARYQAPEFDPEPDTALAPHWYDRESFGRPVEQAEPEESLFEPSATPDASVASVLEPEPEPEPEREAEPAPDAEVTSIFLPYRKPEPGSLFDPEHQEPAATHGSLDDGEPIPPAYAFGGDQAEVPGDDETAAESTQVLPRRQPRTPPRGAFEVPEPIQPSMRSIERREPIQLDEAGRSGSLFEPAVRPKSGTVSAEPAATPAAGSLPTGPFGPGSAMPRPGGGRPAEEFTVKASVTALRYCAEDSPQFPRMVAEVWFRSAEDAERVGFRPLV